MSFNIVGDRSVSSPAKIRQIIAFLEAKQDFAISPLLREGVLTDRIDLSLALRCDQPFQEHYFHDATKPCIFLIDDLSLSRSTGPAGWRNAKSAHAWSRESAVWSSPPTQSNVLNGIEQAERRKHALIVITQPKHAFAWAHLLATPGQTTNVLLPGSHPIAGAAKLAREDD